MQFVIDEFAKVLQEGLADSIGKENILTEKPAFEKPVLLPLVAVYDVGFKFEDSGFGNGLGDLREEKEESFSGDGKKTVFKLIHNPIRSLLNIESPKGSIKNDPDDYRIDYANAAIMFRSPPSRGKNNVFVKYMVAKSVGEVRGLRLKIRCYIDLWAKSRILCDSITVDAIKTIIMKKEELISKGINVVPVEGISITNDGDSTNSEIVSKKGYGRRLVYLAETDIKVEIKTLNVEKVEITSQRWQ